MTQVIGRYTGMRELITKVQEKHDAQERTEDKTGAGAEDRDARSEASSQAAEG